MSSPSGDTFDQFSEVQTAYVRKISETQPVFRVDLQGVWDAFLGGLPEAERQHHNCNCCRSFVNHYGNLVVMDANGDIAPLVWPDPTTVPELYRDSVANIRALFSAAKVAGVFFSDADSLGRKEVGGWTHMWAPSVGPSRNRNRLLTASQREAEVAQLRETLRGALLAYPRTLVEEAVRVLREAGLYRAETVLPRAEWLLTAYDVFAKTRKPGLFWRLVLEAPAGFCNVKSGVLGALLDDIQAKTPFPVLQRRWDTVLNPNQYQRAQAAPAAATIVQAERIFAELGLAPALQRRYLTAGEIPKNAFVWKASGEQTASTGEPTAGIFGHVKPKAAPSTAAEAPTVTGIPAQTITWSKFLRTIVPGVKNLEVQVTNQNASRFMGLVGPADPTAPDMLKWKNGVSWYYHGGADGEMRRRVEKAGGQYTNVDIRCTLLWNTRTDLDVHCYVTPTRRRISPTEHIGFQSKQGSPAVGGGWLDIDMNISGETDCPVENIRWHKGSAVSGHYRFTVHNYTGRDGRSPTPYEVELEVEGQIYRYTGAVNPHVDQTVFEFNYDRNTKTMTNLRSTGNVTAAAVSQTEAWGLPIGSWAKVNGIVSSPNQWDDQTVTPGQTHTFFLLDGCKDTAEQKGRGFFPEMMRGDLHPVRSVIEAHLATQAIQPNAEDTQVCGLGVANDQPWDLTVRVNGGTVYKIDRLD